MSTVVLLCPDSGAIDVAIEDVHPYIVNNDGTATYSFDCVLCKSTHCNLHATLGVALALKYSEATRLRSVRTNQITELDEWLIRGFSRELKDTQDIVARLDGGGV